MAELQRTLVLVKPDGMQRGLAGTILTRLEGRGLKIVGLKLIHIETELARRHYAAHEGKPFFQPLVEYITSSPVMALVLEGPNAVDVVRNTMGATNPVNAAPGTIRGDLALDIGRNLIHGSDSPESASHEIGLFFSEGEVLSYPRDADRWITES